MENFIHPGTLLNPDTDRLEAIEERIKNNLGYCVTSKSEGKVSINSKCPCLKYRELGECSCGKFVFKVPQKTVSPAPSASMEGKMVVITKSSVLSELKLDALVDRKGIVTEELTSPERKSKGYIVRLIGGSHLGEDVWFIPFISVSLFKN